MESFAHHSFSDTLCVTHTNTHTGTGYRNRKRTKKMSERWHRQQSRAIATDGLVRVRGTGPGGRTMVDVQNPDTTRPELYRSYYI